VPVPRVQHSKSRNLRQKKVDEESHHGALRKSEDKKRKKVKDTTPVGIHFKQEGEYIEDLETFELISVDRKEDGNIRKSSRQLKPKTFHDDILTSQAVRRSESPININRKTRKNLLDIENTPRKSKREPKPNKNYESPKKSQSKESLKDEEEEEGEVYIIESIVDQKDGKYLVKWDNYPSTDNTWEPRSSIPRFILKFYEQDPSRLGMPAPDVS